MLPVPFTISFISLLFGLHLLWMNRFDRVEQIQTVRLENIRESGISIEGFEWVVTGDELAIRVHRDKNSSSKAALLRLPGLHEVGWLHMRFRLKANNLGPGSEKWQDGRLILEWFRPGEEFPNAGSCIGTVRFNEDGGLSDFVVPSPSEASIPLLRIEHLGESGTLELAELEIDSVKESTIWTYGKWICLGGWISWVAALINFISSSGALRSTGMALLWGTMATEFAVPGPWQNQNPLLSKFRIGTDSYSPQSSSKATMQDDPASLPLTGAVPALGELKAKGNYALQIKARLTPLRPLLHALLLGIPTLLMAWVVGKKATWYAMLLLALMIEFSQYAFGYGFDATDVADIFFDVMGILIFLWLSKKISDKFPILCQPPRCCRS